jgi:hypothetical protein
MRVNGFVKSHSVRRGGRFILRHCGVLPVRLIPQNLRALHNELFTLPSEFEAKAGFLPDHKE